MANCHSGIFLYLVFSYVEKPLWMAPKFLILAVYNLSIPPNQSDKSGLIGFFTNTILSVPSKASAISCMIKGLTVERAPIQSKSTSCSKARSTWALLATSVAVFIPVSSLTFFNHFKPMAPTPSNIPGRVLGFQIPARK